MKLITGGAFQGKVSYAKEYSGISDAEIVCAESASAEDIMRCRAVSGLHLLIKSASIPPSEAAAFVDGIYESNPNIIIICDEVGSGIVPLERSDRDWREAVGRACCRAAELSELVVRIHCGLPHVIKGQL